MSEQIKPYLYNAKTIRKNQKISLFNFQVYRNQPN